MRFRTLGGGEVELRDELEALRQRLRGQVLLPGEAAYEEARAVWNALIDRRPGAAVRCRGSSDVVTAVDFARRHELLLAIKGGGHNIAGLAVADGALLLDMALERGVFVDARRRLARVQAGCLLGDVDRETQLHGLATVLGFVSATGVAGLTLGGGFGYLTRRWGWTSDNVVGMDVVTAAARRVRASAEENTDLFWGLRGGGGNFGVVTGIDYALHPVGPEILGGAVAWPASEAPHILALYRALAEEAPLELTLVAILRPAPPLAWLPKEHHGQPIVAIQACWSGALRDGEAAAGPIKSFGRPLGDNLIRRPYVELQSLLDATQPRGRRYYWKSEYLARVEPEFCARLVEHAARIRSPHSAILLFQIAGVLNRTPAGHSPAGNRDARYVLNITGSWTDPAEDAAHVEWARGAWNELRAFGTGGNYVNFLTADETPERLAAALGQSVGRLAEIKARWDPENVFRTNRNVAPARR